MNALRGTRWTKIAAFALCSCVAGVLVATPQKGKKPEKPASSCDVIQPLNPDFTLVATLQASIPMANVGFGGGVSATSFGTEVVVAVGSFFETDTVEVFQLNLDGSPAAAQVTLTVPVSGRYDNVVIAAVNTDNFPDIVVGDGKSAFLFLADAYGNGGYEAPIELLPSEASLGFGSSIAVGDLIEDGMNNPDGYPDIVVGAPASGTKDSGKVFIFEPSGAMFPSSSLTIDGADRPGAQSGDRFGQSVAGRRCHGGVHERRSHCIR